MKLTSIEVTYKPWDAIDYHLAATLYESRYKIHQRLTEAFRSGKVDEYVQLALGIEEPTGNYSAAEHGLGPKILEESPPEAVFELAKKLFRCQTAEEIPKVIYKENLHNLKISVGSEMAALLRPDAFWVTNVRTIWAHLVMKHNDNVGLANEELHYYRTQEVPSEMEYRLWRDIHPLVGHSMQELADLGTRVATKRGIQAGNLIYLWADAIADTAYNKYSGKKYSG